MRTGDRWSGPDASWPRSRPGWPTSAATSSSGPGRPTSSATSSREIDRAALAGPDEDDALRTEEERLADLGAHREAAAEALVQLDGSDGAGGAGLLLGAAIAALAGRQPFAADEGRLRATAAEIADLATDLRTAVETWNDDPARLADVQARRQLLADLRRKYGPTLADVLDYRDRAGRQLADLEGAAAAAEILEGERQQAREAVVAAENELRGARQAAAPALADAAGERLRTLAMPDARFDVTVGDDGPGDDVRFLLSANRGEPTQPLARVASGGELARTMLSLRLVAAGGPATMLFDEVDAGVGGAAAVALGAALDARSPAAGRCSSSPTSPRSRRSRTSRSRYARGRRAAAR